MKDTDTRVFFVTDGKTTNEEIFETLEEAQQYMLDAIDSEDSPRVYIAMVKNAYKEDGKWNYEDFSDTFRIVKVIDEI
jgi:hypothetical protein